MTAAAAPEPKPRAVGIVRVSRFDEDTGHSPVVQKLALADMADQRWDLVAVLDENVDDNGRVLRKASGTRTLDDRPQLRQAVEQIEAGLVQIVAAENFDRLFRNLDVQRAFIRRVEEAGGEVWERSGRQSMKRAADKAQSSMKGVFAEYVVDSAKERSFDAVEQVIRDGRIPWPGSPVGYVRGDDGRLHVDRQLAPTIRAAFKLRAKGATIETVRDYLASQGLVKSYHGTMHLLRDRAYLGEIHFGSHTPNLEAHKPIVTPELFDRVQRKTIPRGRRSPSERILARLDVLRCGTCGAAMVVGTHRENGRQYGFYRCPGKGGKGARVRDCSRRVAISATKIEAAVIAATRDAIADIEGRAAAQAGVHDADVAIEQAQADLDGVIETLTVTGAQGRTTAIRRIQELQDALDQAIARREQLGDLPAEAIIRGGRDWDRLTRDEQRALIKAVVRCVTVAPGAGDDRICIELYGD